MFFPLFVNFPVSLFLKLPKEKALKPVLLGKRDRIRNVMYGAYCGGTKPGMRSVRKGDWKLPIKYDVLDGKVRQTQLFNLKQNPEELLVQHQDEAIISKTGNKPMKFRLTWQMIQIFQKRKEMESIIAKQGNGKIE